VNPELVDKIEKVIAGTLGDQEAERWRGRVESAVIEELPESHTDVWPSRGAHRLDQLVLRRINRIRLESLAGRERVTTDLQRAPQPSAIVVAKASLVKTHLKDGFMHRHGRRIRSTRRGKLSVFILDLDGLARLCADISHFGLDRRCNVEAATELIKEPGTELVLKGKKHAPLGSPSWAVAIHKYVRTHWSCQ